MVRSAMKCALDKTTEKEAHPPLPPGFVNILLSLLCGLGAPSYCRTCVSVVQSSGRTTGALPVERQWLVPWSTTSKCALRGSRDLPKTQAHRQTPTFVTSVSKTSRNLILFSDQPMLTGAWIQKAKSPCRSLLCLHHPPMG